MSILIRRSSTNYWGRHWGDMIKMAKQEGDKVSGSKRHSERDHDEDDGDNNDLLYVNYLEQFNRKGPLNFNKFYYKFNRFFTIFLGAYVCNNDLMGGHERCKGGESWSRVRGDIDSSCGDRAGDEQQQQQQEMRLHRNDDGAGGNKQRTRWWARLIDRWRYNLKPMQRSSWRRELRMGWISHTIVVVYFVVTAIMIWNVIELYDYHIDSFRLDRVRKLIATHGPHRGVIFREESVGFHYLVALQLGTNRSSNGGGGGGGGDLFQHELPVLHSESKPLMSLSEFEQALWVRMNETRRTLSYLGDTFIYWGIVSENLFSCINALAFTLYFLTMILFTWFNRPDAQHVRDHLDIEEEQRRVDACCESELLKYFESNRVHTLLILTADGKKFSDLPARYFDQKILERQRERLFSFKSSIDTTTRYHRSTVESTLTGRQYHMSNYNACSLLAQMFTCGALRPINRSNTWIERRNQIEFTLRCIISSYCVFFDTCGVYPIYTMSERVFDLGGLCVLLNLQLINSGINHYVVALVLSCLDQAVTVDHVLSLINKCIRVNEREFVSYISVVQSNKSRYLRKPSRKWWPQSDDGREQRVVGARTVDGQEASEIITRMNANYLFVLMTYKIFVAQLGPYKRTLRGMFIITFSIAFILPVLARIHVPYLELESDFGISPSQIRVLALILNIFMLLPIDLLFLPLCYINSRCLELYKALSSLMAHTTEVRRSTNGIMIYNEHAVNTLIKELSSPELMLEQFVVQSIGGLDGSFYTLLKLHFWWGLVSLSLLIEARGSQQLFGSLFSDPLGVWCFHV